MSEDPSSESSSSNLGSPVEVRVRRIHRRDLNRVWDFLKLCFRDVNRETVEYQRPRSKNRFLEIYEEDGIEQLVFEARLQNKDVVVGYSECAFEVLGGDNWINQRYFTNRDMRPLFVEELAVHPEMQGQGIGAFILEQLDHLARVRGCTHLVLEVAENNENALRFYRSRSFYKLDAAIFLAKKVIAEEELLPPRKLKRVPSRETIAALRGEPVERSASRSRPPRANGSRAKKKS
ncbi:MAG TPA: GNAT family N-acetyltransferase [Labilithrix sp.]|jgi:ribosomal protein S18 acetylase RimI-like enzyme|nr:GNAT family N-acetyltransferase [Labilithrix sp.]